MIFFLLNRDEHSKLADRVLASDNFPNTLSEEEITQLAAAYSFFGNIGMSSPKDSLFKKLQTTEKQIRRSPKSEGRTLFYQTVDKMARQHPRETSETLASGKEILE